MGVGASYFWHEDWIRASTKPLITATFRDRVEDFFVEESLTFELLGSGEHLYLYVEKVELNTQDVQKLLSRHFEVPSIDVAYAGLKDRRAVTRQWFSIRLPKRTPKATFSHPQVRILQEGLHSSKLRRQHVKANRFRIVLRNSSATPDPQLLQVVPNYFGPQRFGSAGQNLTAAYKWVANRRARVSKFRRGIYLSALRSWVFNAILGQRIAAGSWREVQCGDIAVEGSPTGALWGRGHPKTTGSIRELELAVSASNASITEALEWLGVNQERRSLVCRPHNLELANSGNDLELGFELDSGCYATTVLHEVIDAESLGNRSAATVLSMR